MSKFKSVSFLLLCMMIHAQSIFAQTENLSTGSFIVNMGITPQTIANGLKPYGLVYDLVRNYSVPVRWVIASGKVKDGVDFSYNGTQFKGGTFIIPAEYRTAAVNSRITYWTGQGVVGTTTTSTLSVNVTSIIKSYPRWTLDATNGAIAQGYLTNAGITLTAFPNAYNWKTPATLDCCDDFYVMPHADPTWATHGNLYNWNKNCLGSIWAACHAVSALENAINPSNTTQQMNFLSTRTSAVSPTPWPNNSLTLFSSHSGGSIPYTHQNFDDPIAQYMGVTDLAQLNGSEQIYLPKQDASPNNTRWRPGAKIIAYDPTQANVLNPDLANGNVAALIVYGRGFDDPTRGYVMYEAGHSHNKGTAGDVAAQRAFFNFSFFQILPKAPNITTTGITTGQNINSGASVPVSASASSPLTGVTFTYQWSSSCGGTFANPNAANTTFTAPTVVSPTPCTVTCKVSDNCGRTSFLSYAITILSGPQPPVANADAASINVTCGVGTSITTNVLANDTDPGGLPLTLTNVTGASNGTVSFTSNGNVTFTPDANFVGPLTLTYTVCNNTPLCATNGQYTITASGASTPSVANDSYTIAEDSVARFNVLSNDAASLTVMGITSGPSNGKVSINIDNTITYLPNADFDGTDNFTYKVVNASGGTNTATVTITVTADACSAGNYQASSGSSGTYSQGPSKDNSLRQDRPNDNIGGFTYLRLDGETNKSYRTLLQFDLSSIPSTASITNANLKLVATTVRTAGSARDISVYRITNAWDEGTTTTNNTVGISSWNTRAAGPITWTTAGGDFNATAEATTSVAATGTYNWTGGTMNSLIQNWVNGTNTNNGMLLKFATEGTSNDNKDFGSKENGTAGNRPVLSFDWSSPAPCSSIPTRAPQSMPDSASTVNGVAVNIATATNDYYPVAGTKTYSIITAPVSGTATINGTTGVVNYTPATTYNGVRFLTYRVLDNTSGLADTATVYINITDAPVVANNDSPAGALSGTAQTINVLTNDTDADVASLTSPTYSVSIVSQPTNGTVTVNGTGSIVYTPNAGFTGKDTLAYQVCEPTPSCGSPSCDTAYLYLTVINRAPTATNDTKTILPCLSNTIDLIGNDTDPENGLLTVGNVSALSNPSAGTLVNNNDGTVTFTPTTGFTGTVTFTYTVTDNGVTPLTSAAATVSITVSSPVNTAPSINSDEITLNMDETNYASVVDNDSDPENNTLTNPTVTVQPLHGTATVLANGLIKYIPNPGYYGADTLTYQICDIINNPATCSTSQDKCDTARLYYTILAPNTVVAISDENSTWVNTPVSGSVLDNDVDPEGDTPIQFNGFIIGGVSYTSGTVTVSGVDASGNPVANAGTLLINADGTYTFTPANNFTGIINVPYAIQDGNPNTAYDTAILHIAVVPLPFNNNSVIANNDEYKTFINVNVNGNVITSNDYDPQGDAFTVTSFTFDSDGNGTQDGTGTMGTAITIGGVTTSGLPVSNAGTITLNADGSFTFNPQDDFTGSVDIVYTITDANGATSTAILHIDIVPDVNGPLNDPPKAGDDFAFTPYNTPVSGNFAANDGDPNSNPISYNGTTINPAGPATPIGAPVTTAQGGTIQFYANGTYLYTPPANYTGPDQVNYQICDVTAVSPQPLCNTAMIHFVVSPVNTTSAVNDENSTWQDVNVSGNVSLNDYDVEGNTQTFGSFLNQSNSSPLTSGTTVSGVSTTGSAVANAGTLTFDANGNYTFDPDPLFIGTVSIPYSVCDDGIPSTCDTAYLTITVSPLPASANSVIANNDENISYGSAVSNNLLLNDADPQADQFTVTAVSGGTVGSSFTVSGVDQNGNTINNAGTLIINADGSYTYTPAAGFTGTINVPYTITDNNASPVSTSAVLHIIVMGDPNGPQNDPPFSGDDFGYTYINTPVNGNFSGNDLDPNTNPISYDGTTINPAGPATPIGAPVTTTQGGTIQFYANGTYLYTPPANYSGPDQVNYEICDVTAIAPQPLCNSAVIHLLVSPTYALSASSIQLTSSVSADGLVKLNWITLTENNTHHFVIERSFDNKTFSSIGTQPAAGTSLGQLVYSSNDHIAGLPYNVVYYRVKLFDTDGSFKYSNISVVRLTDASVKIWPNPARDFLQISYFSNAVTAIEVHVVDVHGKVMLSQKASISKGINLIDVKGIQTLSQGTYFVEISGLNATQKNVYKFIKTK